MQTDNEKELIKSLREEAWLVKNCFTQHSFQALAFGSVVLGLIARFQADYPLVGLSGILITVLVLAVARIGTHKYATANRNYGYQLFLEGRSREDVAHELGWEEAMHAWRIVQSTVFHRLYHTGKWRFNFLKKEYKDMKCKWFEPPSLIEKGANWHAGGYLGNMLVVLHIFAFISIVPPIFSCIQLYIQANHNKIAFYFALCVTIFVIFGFMFRVVKSRARLRILESGLLSIHSCAVMWKIVFDAHNKVLMSTGKYNKYYTNELSRLAIDISNDLESIY